MPKFEANIQFMYNEYEVLDRYDAAARAGFTGVELQAPYGVSIPDIMERLQKNNLTQVLINLPGTDPDSGKQNLAINPHRQDLFRERIDMGLEYAKGLGVLVVNSGVGPAIDGVSEEDMWGAYIENIKYAAPLFAEIGTKLAIEPINTRDQPGFFINTSAGGAMAVMEVEHENFGLQYDVYHMQIMEGDLAPHLEAHLDIISHIQIADTPGRHEPGTGEINYPFIFDHLDRIGYTGWVGAEYNPIGHTEDGLDWVKPYLQVS
jgi:hydroxypyruvate isomerase